MRARLLIVDAGEVADRLRLLDARQSHHLVRVLRLCAGESIECFDGTGSRFEAVIERADPRGCAIRIGARLPSSAESALRLTLVQCISSAERMDWTVEKAVELGVHAIRPLMSARSQVRLDTERARRRHRHWSRIIEAACMQCGRDLLPTLHEAVSFEQWIASVPPRIERAVTVIVLSPTATMRLSDVPIDVQQDIELLVGPESGFSDAELEQARATGLVAARLGPRTLRTETAGIAAIVALQTLAGDF